MCLRWELLYCRKCSAVIPDVKELWLRHAKSHDEVVGETIARTWFERMPTE